MDCRETGSLRRADARLLATAPIRDSAMNAQSGTFSVLSCTLSAPITYVARLQWLRVLIPLLVWRKPEALPRREAWPSLTTPAPTTPAPTTPPAPSHQYDGVAHVKGTRRQYDSIAHVRWKPALKRLFFLFLISCSFPDDREKGLSVRTYYA